MKAQPCTKCSGPISFRKNAKGKWVPCELDGSDHWDICTERRRKEWGLVNADGTLNMEALRKLKPPIVTEPAPQFSHVCSGSVPPWDESLGDFRDFTPEEKADGEVCRPIDSAGQLPAV
jgi:hypothetical protein